MSQKGKHYRWTLIIEATVDLPSPFWIFQEPYGYEMLSVSEMTFILPSLTFYELLSFIYYTLQNIL